MNKNRLQADIGLLVEKYSDDLFFGDELEILSERIHSLESSIAVIGQFSVGKSALLNALLGEEILSTRRIESTKVLTRIRNCPSRKEAKVALTYLEGGSRTFPIDDIDDLEKYTTFQGDEVTDTLAAVDLYWPVRFLNEELVLVDTPGANSLTKSAFETTRMQLKKSSAILYLFNGQKGLETTDHELLNEFVSNGKKVFLVGTHIDRMNSSHEWNEVVKEVQFNLDDMSNFDIIGVSSTLALKGKMDADDALLSESNIASLEDVLGEYMASGEYHRAELRSIESDYIQLDAEIKEVEAEQFKGEQEREDERTRRHERLTAITELDYADVENYGKTLLRRRGNIVRELGSRLEENILREGKDILHKVTASYSSFSQQLNEKMENLAKGTIDIESLKNDYIGHLNHVEQIYIRWGKSIEDSGYHFIETFDLEVRRDDKKFLNALKTMENDVEIKWENFDSILMSISFEPLRLDLDLSDFDVYESQVDKEESRRKKLKTKLSTVEGEQKQIAKTLDEQVSEVENKKKSVLSDIGERPKPERQYRETGILFWKKSVPDGYDYSRPNLWDERYREITAIYEQDLARINEVNRDLSMKNERKRTRALKEIDDLEEAIHSKRHAFLSALYSIINDQSKIVLETHSERLNDIRQEWERLLIVQEERHDAHLQTIEDQFVKFVNDSKQVAIKKIRVL
ncbi:dynamin family protein [Exiguobacterium sp. SH0S1]|uniref:dynamin family protein n=2 Tax=unclassified Exiguobacterium TaxID=2644629 RepID=UPI0013758961|nr:dynamin family protein [Exiguobacterium sp. SH0S1]